MLNAARVFLLTGSFWLIAAGVEAKEPPRRADAQRHYDAGISHYKAQEYDAAAEELEAAYRLKPEPSWLYNLAQASRLAHRLDKALDYYRQYLSAEPDAENRPAVEQRIADVEKAIAMEKAPVSPPPVSPAPSESAPVATATAPGAALDLPRTPYQLGARLRGIFVTSAMLSPYLQTATSMESWSLGIEFIYRKPKFDVVTSLDFSWIDVHDGNWLANGHDAAFDTHFLQFRGLSFLSADVSIIGHHALTNWLEIRYGGGLGLGVVLGDVLTVNNWSGCTVQNASNLAACHPVGVDLTSPNREAQLKATEANAPPDTAGNPRRHVSADKPPVMGVLNVLVGLRFKLPKRVTAQVEIGFRDAIFFGAGFHYLF